MYKIFGAEKLTYELGVVYLYWKYSNAEMFSIQHLDLPFWLQ